MKQYKIGGQLHDAIFQLMVPSHHFKLTGEKSIILLSEEGDGFPGFSSLQEVFDQLEPIMAKQAFCESFKIYEGEEILPENNLAAFRSNPKLYKGTWGDIFLGISKPEAWLDYPKQIKFKGLKVYNLDTYPVEEKSFDVSSPVMPLKEKFSYIASAKEVHTTIGLTAAIAFSVGQTPIMYFSGPNGGLIDNIHYQF